MEKKNNVVGIGRALPQKTVLIVDDKYSFLKATARLLSLEPRIKTLTAQRSVESFEKLQRNPDLVLMDLDLGDDEPTGIELVSDFRENGFKGIIYVITGNSDPKKLSEAFDAGANGYIVKCSRSEGSLKDKVTGLLFPEDNSTGGGRWPRFLRHYLPLLEETQC